MELWCVSDGAAFASKLAVCPITSTPPLTGLKPAYDENCQGIKLRIAHKIKRLNSRLQVKHKSKTRYMNAWPKAQIERYYYHDDIIRAF